jgi:3-methylfumaryl-CoA hydratase
MLTLSSVTIGSRLNERTHEPSAVSLFLYNAVIWNPHRIHFDEPYTTQIEKHPGLVVDGPLQGDWLSQAVMEWLGDDGELMQLEYSNRRAAYLGERLRTGGEVVDIDRDTGIVTLDIYIKNADDKVIAPGRAIVRLGD